MTNPASHFIGSIPEHYDRELGPRIFTAYADELSSRVARFAPASVLELAAGTGIVTRSLRNALPTQSTLLASDLNPPMLDVARAKFQPEELVSFETVDATCLQFEDESFDALVCQFGVMFFPDKELSYREALRVLKPGGRYFFSVWGTWEKNPFAKIAHELVATFFPDNPPGFYHVPFGYNDWQLIEQELTGAGFSQVSFESVELSSNIPSVEEFARGLVYGNPLQEEILARQGDPNEVCIALALAIEDELGENMPLQAIFIEGAKC